MKQSLLVVLPIISLVLLSTGIFFAFKESSSTELRSSNLQRPATKLEFNSCVQDKACFELDCKPGSSQAEACLYSKQQYKTCAWDNKYCEQYSDVFDNLPWGAPVPDVIRKCWEPEQCGASIKISPEYYRYQQCFYQCTFFNL